MRDKLYNTEPQFPSKITTVDDDCEIEMNGNNCSIFNQGDPEDYIELNNVANDYITKRVEESGNPLKEIFKSMN